MKFPGILFTPIPHIPPKNCASRARNACLQLKTVTIQTSHLSPPNETIPHPLRSPRASGRPFQKRILPCTTLYIIFVIFKLNHPSSTIRFSTYQNKIRRLLIIEARCHILTYRQIFLALLISPEMTVIFDFQMEQHGT
jgi:hypothetical protein